MRIIFRVDSSAEIGYGHIIRCLAIAKELKEFHDIIFATAEDSTNSFIEDAGYEVFLKNNAETEEDFLVRISETLAPDTIVFDKKYPYSIERFSLLKDNGIKIVILDNLCKGLAVADEIVFPIAHLDKSILSNYLSGEQINKVRTGFEYVILRDEIIDAKKGKKLEKNQREKIPNIVVTTGGSDPEGVLLRLIPWFKDMEIDAKITILVGNSFKYRSELDNLIVDLPGNIVIKPYSVEELIKGDLAVCTFGMSIYELIYLQISTICISHNRENTGAAAFLSERYDVIEDLGYMDELKIDLFIKKIKKMLKKSISCRKNQIQIDEYGSKRIRDIIIGCHNIILEK